MPSRRTGHAEDVHSSCQIIDGNSHRFCVLFVDFPTGACLDVSVQPLQRGLCIPVTHRMFDGTAERLGAKFLMRSGSPFAVIEPCRSVIVAGMWAFDLCRGFGHFRPRGHGAPFRDVRRSGSREQPQSGALCTRWRTTPSRSSPSIWGVASTANQTCCPGMLLAYPDVLGLFNTDPVGREGGWMAHVLEKPLGSWDGRQCVLPSRQQSRPRKPHLSVPPIWRAPRGQLRCSLRYR